MLALDKKMFLLSLTDNIDNMSREEYNHKKLIISNNINKKFTPTPKKTILYDPIESQKYKKDYNKLARNYRCQICDINKTNQKELDNHNIRTHKY